jgi:hypothetical protein
MKILKSNTLGNLIADLGSIRTAQASEKSIVTIHLIAAQNAMFTSQYRHPLTYALDSKYGLTGNPNPLGTPLPTQLEKDLGMGFRGGWRY